MAAAFANTHVSSSFFFFFFFFFFFSIALVFLVFPASSSSTGSITVQDIQIIKNACSYASGYTSLCISSLSAWDGGLTADITGLMGISLDIAFKNGMTNQINIGEYAQEATDPVVRGVMVNCWNKYVISTTAIFYAKSAAVEAKNRDEALRRSSVAITGVQQCGEALKKLQGGSVPFHIGDNEKELGLLNIADLMITLALK